ncbi:MAG TPA: S1C family serine protease [candidate division Zixibacteria bacterium]|nr:S1C family serine protease [candidate division Zixibacteria bacterium]
MLTKFPDKTALKLSILALLAVFFSTSSFAEDRNLNQLEQSFNDLVTHLSRSVVTVEASHPVVSDRAGQTPNDAIFSMVSTGIIYDSIGHILTMASSIVGRSTIVVRFEDQSYPANIQAIDYQSGLALLRCPQKFGVPAKLNRQSDCTGKMVLAMGSAYGLRATPSIGFCAGVRPDGIMQFTAMITSGTLGGGLFDLGGNLVGLINGGIGPQGKAEVGLALPATQIPEVVQYLVSNGDRPAGYLGLATAEIEVTPPIVIRSTGEARLTSSGEGGLQIDRGVLINRVVPNSPAARAGLRPQDLMFEAGGHRIYSVLELADMVRHSAPGTRLDLGLLRQNSPYYIQVTIGESRTAQSLPDATLMTPGQQDNDLPLSRDSLLNVLNQMQERIQYLELRVKQLE